MALTVANLLNKAFRSFSGLYPLEVALVCNLLWIGSRVDKQECATPDLSCTICRYPAPTAEFFVYVTFFQRNAALPQSSVRARAGHRPCSVKPSQVHEGKLSKRLAARASSKRLRQQKIPPWANPSGVAHSCLSTLDWVCLLSHLFHTDLKKTSLLDTLKAGL